MPPTFFTTKGSFLSTHPSPSPPVAWAVCPSCPVSSLLLLHLRPYTPQPRRVVLVSGTIVQIACAVLLSNNRTLISLICFHTLYGLSIMLPFHLDIAHCQCLCSLPSSSIGLPHKLVLGPFEYRWLTRVFLALANLLRQAQRYRYPARPPVFDLVSRKLTCRLAYPFVATAKA